MAGACASCVPCAATGEVPQNMVPNITTATPLILGGSNLSLCMCVCLLNGLSRAASGFLREIAQDEQNGSDS